MTAARPSPPPRREELRPAGGPDCPPWCEEHRSHQGHLLHVSTVGSSALQGRRRPPIRVEVVARGRASAVIRMGPAMGTRVLLTNFPIASTQLQVVESLKPGCHLGRLLRYAIERAGWGEELAHWDERQPARVTITMNGPPAGRPAGGNR